MTEKYSSTAAGDSQKRPAKEFSKDWKLEFFALIGFCASGTIFIISGVRNGDILTIAGSLVWIVSCIVWMLTYRKYLDR